MEKPVTEARLLELEKLYRSTRERQVLGSNLYHYNDGRVIAIRELRLELFPKDGNKRRDGE